MCDFRDPPKFLRVNEDTVKQVKYCGGIPLYKIYDIEKNPELSGSFIEGVYRVTEITGSGYVYFDGEHFWHNRYPNQHSKYWFGELQPGHVLFWEQCEEHQ